MAWKDKDTKGIYTFRQSNPAIVGVEVMGRIKTGTRLIKKNGKEIGKIKEIQKQGKSVTEVQSGEQVAVSITNATVGRHIHEEDELISFIPRSHMEIIENRFKGELSEEELSIIQEFKNAG